MRGALTRNKAEWVASRPGLQAQMSWKCSGQFTKDHHQVHRPLPRSPARVSDVGEQQKEPEAKGGGSDGDIPFAPNFLPTSRRSLVARWPFVARLPGRALAVAAPGASGPRTIAGARSTLLRPAYGVPGNGRSSCSSLRGADGLAKKAGGSGQNLRPR